MSQIIIPNPSWDSELTNIILDLEKLRTKQLGGDVPPHIFFQLKNIFHILETLGSARIEGNNTTLAEYVERIITKEKNRNEQNDEIENLEKAILFIEENTDENTLINRAYISEIHKIVTRELSLPPEGEGSRYPGELRKIAVSINSSGHTPPDPMVLQEKFDDFVEFINTERKEQYQLLMVAIAHHRFEHIHPFDNGNGRMGRLLNYAFLIKLGFKVKNGRLLNPSSVFYADRDQYYSMLSKTDSLEDKHVLDWCEYFLLGMKNEIEKIDSLLSNDYVKSVILLPTLKYALENEHITHQEYKVLEFLINSENMCIKSADLSGIGIKETKKKTTIMTKLKEKNIIDSTAPNGRIYTIKFSNNYLLRGVMKTLKENGFISEFLNNN